MNITKEKWVIDSGTNEKEDLFIWKASKYGEYYGSGAIATVHGDKAIAGLIVAAPELLAALQPFANFACDDWRTHKCHNCIAKQVIAKAEGSK